MPLGRHLADLVGPIAALLIVGGGIALVAQVGSGRSPQDPPVSALDVDADVIVPVVFETTDGDRRLCTYNVSVETGATTGGTGGDEPYGAGGPPPATRAHVKAVTRLIEAQNWTGRGQTAYDAAVAQPGSAVERNQRFLSEYSAALFGDIPWGAIGVTDIYVGGSSSCDITSALEPRSPETVTVPGALRQPQPFR